MIPADLCHPLTIGFRGAGSAMRTFTVMERRTTFITAAAITGVILTGTTAVAANIGILTAADSDNIGDLSATAVTTTVDPTPTSVEPQVIDVYLEEPAIATTSTVSPSTTDVATAQEFAVVDAGTVSLESSGATLALDDVEAADGWDYSIDQPTDTEIRVTFTSGEVTYVLIAELGADGTIDARVDQPIVEVVQGSAPGSSAPATTPTSAPANTAPSSTLDDDDDHEGDDDFDDDFDDDDDDDDFDDDFDDDDDHDGRDDDD